MSQFVDLHMHTNCSDGLCTPAEILEKVRSSGISAFAITDHDTINGYKAVQNLLTEDDPELICGVELSSSHEDSDLHILAYGFNPDYIQFIHALTRFQEARNERGQKMVEKLNQLGVKISYQDVEKIAGPGVIGRPHVATAIFDSGVIRRYNEAFEKYIGVGGPAYVAKANFTPREAIELIHEAGGAAVLAHPGVGGVCGHIPMLVELGLDGLEVFHPEHSSEDILKFKKIAQEFGLSITGGSDFHGREGRNNKIGSQKVSFNYLTDLLLKTKAHR